MTTKVFRVEVDEPCIHVDTQTILPNTRKGFFTAFHQKRWEVFDYDFCECEDDGEDEEFCDECKELQRIEKIISNVLSPPPPHSDCRHSIATNEVCVFANEQQLLNWFTPEILEWAHKYFGASVYQYDVAEDAPIIMGAWQAVIPDAYLSNRRPVE